MIPLKRWWKESFELGVRIHYIHHGSLILEFFLSRSRARRCKLRRPFLCGCGRTFCVILCVLIVC
jgi:hypothetical protein